jgi:AcrR family transcriptional regulator
MRMVVRAHLAPAQARQEKARQRARRDILEAAAGVFARRGYAAATLADLAQAAGYAAPSLYRYFASKEEIFRSLIELIKEDLRATFEAPVRPGSPLAERLEGLLTAQLELSLRRRDFFAYLLSGPPSAPGGDGPEADPREGASLYERLMSAWLARHARPAELRCPLPEASRALAAVAHAFHQALILGPDQGHPPAAEARRIVDLVLHGIATPTAGRAARRGAKP